QTGGRPGEDNLRRVERSDFRLPDINNISNHGVLRRPVESAEYCAHDYQKILHSHGFKASMSGKGNCYNNSAVESFFKSLKAELVWRGDWHARRDAEIALFECINGFYNPRRKHSGLSWKSPVDFEQRAA
ncbi:IS3 family transposase, partial [Paracoccus beibuensis]|uniref:IS3 family transposase n=1 Tax=Paracoccus beibuensis TaxID=547602 RepID=UPI0022400F4C